MELLAVKLHAYSYRLSSIGLTGKEHPMSEGPNDKELNEKDFEVTELDDKDLDDVAGGIESASPNNCDCPINNCDV
jgi:hypothetical protein